MSFLTGISFVIPLAFFTYILFYLSKLMPKEAFQLPVFFLIAGDAIMVGIWFYGLKEFTESIKEFKLGIALAFALAGFGRSIYFVLQNRSM